MTDDKEFVEKLRTLGFVQRYKPGAKHRTEVTRDDDGKRAGEHVEHYDGSVDAVAQPRTLRYKLGIKEE